MFGVDAPMNRCIKNDEFCADCEYYEFGSEKCIGRKLTIMEKHILLKVINTKN